MQMLKPRMRTMKWPSDTQGSKVLALTPKVTTHRTYLGNFILIKLRLWGDFIILADPEKLHVIFYSVQNLCL